MCVCVCVCKYLVDILRTWFSALCVLCIPSVLDGLVLVVGCVLLVVYRPVLTVEVCTIESLSDRLSPLGCVPSICYRPVVVVGVCTVGHFTDRLSPLVVCRRWVCIPSVIDGPVIAVRCVPSVIFRPGIAVEVCRRSFTNRLSPLRCVPWSHFPTGYRRRSFTDALSPLGCIPSVIDRDRLSPLGCIPSVTD